MLQQTNDLAEIFQLNISKIGFAVMFGVLIKSLNRHGPRNQYLEAFKLFEKSQLF